MKLKNKKIIVFGGTSGIGLETIKLLLQNGASKVYAISRDPKKVKIRKKANLGKIFPKNLVVQFAFITFTKESCADI